MIRPLIALAALMTLTACVSPTGPAAPDGATLLAPGEGPPDARSGACYGKDVTPAVIESVTEQVLIQPAQIASDGAVIAPAVYKTDVRQRIVQERRDYFFEVPCPHLFTVEFVSTLQRALTVRGVYKGPINGTLDPRTRKAIRNFQLPGFNSDLLTMDSARRLGLIAYERGASDGS
ncbi:peptidoglycan-binding domain-containing protein [Aliiroseovarius subalbicans]|uniref:peptidoglycan-binding domain-containing protein n=1 Tax=Aliiroseovarius subalbicans TaxID=2925840 RepID=UPI001F575FCB|nr:peptidoglycan-binding domain-containing protein [Aliiroseovarius subalbicans]MCI2400486.1 peptidoglycan-binding protein [Aliiroseovarius subalbicans]